MRPPRACTALWTTSARLGNNSRPQLHDRMHVTAPGRADPPVVISWKPEHQTLETGRFGPFCISGTVYRWGSPRCRYGTSWCRRSPWWPVGRSSTRPRQRWEQEGISGNVCSPAYVFLPSHGVEWRANSLENPQQGEVDFSGHLTSGQAGSP